MELPPFVPDTTPRQWLRDVAAWPRHVSIDVQVDPARRSISGTVVHDLERVSVELPVVLQAGDIDIESVTVDDRTVGWSHQGGSLRVDCDADGRFRLGIVFRCETPDRGFHFIPADAARDQVVMAWTQGAMQEHSAWLPCVDDPRAVSSFACRITHPTALTALANGVCEGRDERGDGWAVTSYRQDQPHALYLLSIVVGDFETIDWPGSVPITDYVPRTWRARAAATGRATAWGIDWLSARTGVPFPWLRYGHVLVHGFPWGGMENASLTTLADRAAIDAATIDREGVASDRLVLHELAHQWFGDLVAPRSWTHVWLNESFATWCEALSFAAWRATQGDDEAAVLAEVVWDDRQAWLAQERRRYSRALVTDQWREAEELFDRVAYEKGGLILQQLTDLLGEAVFWQGVRTWLERHAHAAADSDDLRRVLEDVSGRPLDRFATEFWQRPGCPRINLSREARRGRQVLVAVQDGEPWAVEPEVWLAVGDQIIKRRWRIDQARSSLAVSTVQEPDWVVVDPHGRWVVDWDESLDRAEALRRLGDERLPVTTRARAADTLGRGPAVDRVLDALVVQVEQAGPRLVRRQALLALGRIRGDRARDLLIDRLRNLTDPQLRISRAEALARWRGDAQVAAHLEAALADEPADGVRGALLRARGVLRYGGATAILRPWLARRSWHERLAIGVVQGLGASREPAAIDELMQILQDSNQPTQLRAEAARQLPHLAHAHPWAADRVRLALADLIESTVLAERMGAIDGFETLQQAQALPLVEAALGDEINGIARRRLREVIDTLRQLTASNQLRARQSERLDELERQVERLRYQLRELDDE